MLKSNLSVLLSLVPRVGGGELWVQGWRAGPSGLESCPSWFEFDKFPQ